MRTSDPPQDLAAFCAREHPRLVGALGLYCGDPQVAEDVAQDALVRVCRNWQRVRRMDAPGAWAHRVAINLVNSHFRRRASGRKALHRLGNLARDDLQPEISVEALALREAIPRLPLKERTAVVLHYYLGYSVVDAAAVMRMPAGTVKSLLHRGRRRLRPAVDPRLPDGDPSCPIH